MLILSMSISGSAVFLAVLISAVLGKRLVSSAWVYNMLKINLFFFCFPLPKYNSGYQEKLFHLLGISRRWNMTDIAAENIIGIEQSGRLHVNFQTYIILIWMIWACGLLVLFCRNIRMYRKVKALKEIPQMRQLRYLEVFDRLKKELGIKKETVLMCADDNETVCTIGVFRKYIIVPERGLTDEEIYYSLKHELIHAKRSDVAWRYIGLFAVLLHWFNPLAYLYFYVMSVYCEQSCDAILVRNLDKTERKKYGELIIRISQDDGMGKWKYRTSLTGSKKIIEWRLINMLKNGKRKKIEVAMSLLLSAVILFGGSLTVCAYEKPQVISGEADFFENFSDKQDTTIFIVAEEIRYSEEEVLDFIEFVGDDGSRYDLSKMQSGNMERADCIHSFVGGYIKIHHKNSDGSCKTDYYHADVCNKCGYAKNKEYSHTETSSKCTH